MPADLDPPPNARKGLPLVAIAVLAIIALTFIGYMIHYLATAF